MRKGYQMEADSQAPTGGETQPGMPAGQQPIPAQQPPGSPGQGAQQGTEQPPPQPQQPPTQPQNAEQQPQGQQQGPSQQPQEGNAAQGSKQDAKPEDQNMPGYDWKPRHHHKKLAAGILILAVVAVLGYYVYMQLGRVTPPPVNITNTTPKGEILGCMTINSAGNYYLNNNVYTGISSGSCIQIDSSNVRIDGRGMNITGSGPYTTTVPPTYGIRISGASNVTIDSLSVSRFSYGIYVNGSSGVSIYNSTAKTSTISGIVSYHSRGTSLYGDNITAATSNTGALELVGGGNSLVENTLIQNNAYYGAYVNSTGNRFVNTRFLNNPIDLFCNSTDGFRSYSTFVNTTCSFNTGCNFASCSQTNVPYNTSQSFFTNSNIDYCGTINESGTYTLQHSLYTPDYVNTSTTSSRYDACIYVDNVPNVVLNCNGQSITGGYFGVYINGGTVGIFNVSLENCRFSNDTYGAYIYHVFSPNINNTRFNNTVYGIYMANATTGQVNNLTGTASTYGVYVNQTVGVTYTNLHLYNNIYGIYVLNSGSNIYQNSRLNNTNSDFYCSRSTYNSTGNVYHNVSCVATDCGWATSCRVHKLPPVPTFYLSSCQAITVPGNFALASSVLSSGTCFDVRSSNVSFSCDGRNVESNTGAGSGFLLSGVQNISINDCNIGGFSTGISASNSRQLELGQISVNNSASVLNFQNVVGSRVTNITGTEFRTAGFRFINTSYSIVENDSADGGTSGSTGFNFSKASNDLIAFDTADANQGNGFYFGDARNNNIMNNTAVDNLQSDYYCTPDSSGIYANNGIDTGINKTGCHWMVVESADQLLRPVCGAISPGITTLSADMIYPYGATCFSAYNWRAGVANGDTLNCNGHTVLAKHGGTFFDVINATGVTLENCYLEGFGTAVIGTANSFNLHNDTIFSSNVSMLLTNTYNPNVTRNVFNNDSYGVIARKVYIGYQFGSIAQIQNNQFINANTAIVLDHSTGLNVSSNFGNAREVGIRLLNGSSASISNNHISAPQPLSNSSAISQAGSGQSGATAAGQSQQVAIANMSNFSSSALTATVGGFWNSNRNLVINNLTASAMGYSLNATPNILFYRYKLNWSYANVSQMIQQFGYNDAIRFSFYEYYKAPAYYLFNNAYAFDNTAAANQTYNELVSQVKAQQGTTVTYGTYNGVPYAYALTNQAGNNLLLGTMLAHSGRYVGIIVEEANLSSGNMTLTGQNAQVLLGDMISS